jgi:hypothetical protein
MSISRRSICIDGCQSGELHRRRRVVGIHIDDALIVDGRVDIARAANRPARLYGLLRRRRGVSQAAT